MKGGREEWINKGRKGGKEGRMNEVSKEGREGEGREAERGKNVWMKEWREAEMKE